MSNMLNAEYLRQMMDRIGQMPKYEDPFRFRPLSFAGFDIYEVKSQPVLQISPDFPHVSDEFRAEWNAWALERFGFRDIVPVNTAFVCGNRIFMNPRSVANLVNFT